MITSESINGLRDAWQKLQSTREAMKEWVPPYSLTMVSDAINQLYKAIDCIQSVLGTFRGTDMYIRLYELVDGAYKQSNGNLVALAEQAYVLQIQLPTGQKAEEQIASQVNKLRNSLGQSITALSELISMVKDKNIDAAIKLEEVFMTSILFLAADPSDKARLRLGRELREIQEKLQLGKLRERFRLEQRMSVRPEDISQALLDVQPRIVHFSGHGTSNGALSFENQIGQTHPILPAALSALFEQFSHHVDCVILNACYSDIQARAISKHINYVIGMNEAIGDKAAIAFAVGFYQALGAGQSVGKAFDLGRVQIQLQNIPEHLTPVLLRKEEV